MPGGFQVERLQSLAEARAFAPEWRELHVSSESTNPFTDPLWLLSWAEQCLNDRDELWLLAIRRAGVLVGVAPFYRRRVGVAPMAVSSMQLLGTARFVDFIEMPTVLATPRMLREVVRSSCRYLAAHRQRWDWAEVPLGGAAPWLEPEWLLGSSVTVLLKTVRAAVVLPLPGTVEELRPLLKRNIRESLRRGRNRLAATGLDWHIRRTVDPAGMSPAIARLGQLHRMRAQMSGKRHHPDRLCSPSAAGFLSRLAPRLADFDAVSVYELELAGEPIASQLVLHTATATYFSISGMSPRGWPYSPIPLLQRAAIEDAIHAGHREVNFSPGPDEAKLRWSKNVTLYPEFAVVGARRGSRCRFAVFWELSAAAGLRRESARHRRLDSKAAVK